METLTFPYGETPEEVIRRRFDALAYAQSKGPGALKEIAVDEGEVTPRAICGFRDTDDLLTVLDALFDRSIIVVDGNPDGYCDDLTRTTATLVRSGQLRISILAALGIKEA